MMAAPFMISTTDINAESIFIEYQSAFELLAYKKLISDIDFQNGQNTPRGRRGTSFSLIRAYDNKHEYVYYNIHFIFLENENLLLLKYTRLCYIYKFCK